MVTQHFIDKLEVFSCPADFPADQPPILFIHGAFAGGWMWTDTFMPYLASQGHPCYAVSLRCHGGSQGYGDIDWVSVSDYVDDVEQVVEWLKSKEDSAPVLVGHSMGGFVAQKYLERHPARACALLCSVPPQGLIAAQVSLIMQKPHLFAEINSILNGNEEVELDVLREALFAGDVDDELLRTWTRKMQNESHRAIWDMSMFSLPQMRLIHKSPMLIVGAEKDALVPPFLAQATGQTYGLPVHIFNGMGHVVTHEKAWRDVADLLHDWIVESDI